MSDNNLARCQTLERLSLIREACIWVRDIVVKVTEHTMIYDMEDEDFERVEYSSFSTIREVADFLEANYLPLQWDSSEFEDLCGDSWFFTEIVQDQDGVYTRYSVAFEGACSNEIRALAKEIGGF